MIGNAPHSHITGVPGWESPAEQELLVKLAQAVPQNGAIIEVGAEYGMSASLFCFGAKSNVEIISYDLFPGDMIQIHESNLTEAGFYGVSERIRSDSSEAGRNWSTNDLDLVFIDADHSYAGVRADIEAWTPHVKVGGRVAFHDCIYAANFHADHLYQFDIMRAISEWFVRESQSWRTLEYVDSIMVFERTA